MCRVYSLFQANSSEDLVRTSLLFSSTSGLRQKDSQQRTATDDLLTLGGILHTKSPTLVPSDILRSSCSILSEETPKCSNYSSFPFTPTDDVDEVDTAYRFAGYCTDEEAYALLKKYPFIVFRRK
ncbi:hypothetical protein NECAME_18030, partial [Necator americanus]